MIKQYAIPLLSLGLAMALQAGETLPDSNRMKPGHAPTPFTADEIKAFCTPGHTATYRMELAGRDPFLRISAFEESDNERAQFTSYQKTLDGVPIGESQTGNADWTQLQGHASFPEENTTISSEELTVPAGTYDCWRYDVKLKVPSREKKGETVTSNLTFWFAKELPGPPVKMIQEVDGTKQVVMTLEKLER